MEVLFNGNIIFIFFFAMIAIYNYSDLKEYQRIAIIYITVYSLALTGILDILLSIVLLFVSMVCFLEILTEDETKFKILVNPLYKILDCLYLSFSQYAFFEVLVAIILCNDFFISVFHGSKFVFMLLSGLMIIVAITSTLRQKFVISSFGEMYKVFTDFPINKVDFNQKLKEASDILVSIEDRTYYERKGYTLLSLNAIKCILKQKPQYNKFSKKVKYVCGAGKRFVKNTLKENRGYSTIPMQLIRALGVKRGYNCAYRRKVFEFLYSKMFFDGVKRLFNEDLMAKRENIKEYYLYIYFHSVNTFLGDAKFSKFLNAFDMQYDKKNTKDIYDCSNEGIFIACMGLSKRAIKINKDNIDYYLSIIYGVQLDKDKICDMVSIMMSKPYDENYLE